MTDLARDLEALVPPFDDSDADWQDALLRSGGSRRWPVALLAATLVAAAFAATSLGTTVGGDAFDRLSAWVSGEPGDPAPEDELRIVRDANARSAAPIPADTELGLLATRRINGVEFQLLGFRDRESLCLRLRNSAGQESRIVKAPASCVSKELLVDLGKPLAVVAAADPFPRTARRGHQALYGLAADGVAVVELDTEGGSRRVEVQNNAFLVLYEGESPRLTDNRLDYQSDVPSHATALDASGAVLGSVRIMSLKRGYPGGLSSVQLPGPDVVERPIHSPRVGWLDRGEKRGAPFETPVGSGHFRSFRPNPATSMRVAVGASVMGAEPVYCLTNVWPLQRRVTGLACPPVDGRPTFLGAASPMFDAQFPVHYGLVTDGVASLELVLANGKRSAVSLVDNVFTFQTSSAQSAKLVGYDEDGRVALIQVIPPTP